MTTTKLSTKKLAFLKAFAKCWIVTKAAKAAGISRQSHYDWLGQGSGDPSEEDVAAYKAAFQ